VRALGRLPRPLLPAVLLGAGFGVRLLVVRLTPGYIPRHDDLSYLKHALALERTGAYPILRFGSRHLHTAYRPPGLPAAVHATLGGNVRTDRLVQVVVGTILVGLIGVVAWQVWDRRTALVAMGLAALSPALVLFGASIISESLFAALEVGAVAAALQARRAERRIRWALLAGVLAGLAALTRPQGLIALPAIALIAWRPDRRAALAIVVAGLGAISPWTIRNAITMHAFVPISTEAGNTLAGTYNSVAWHKRAQWVMPRKSHVYTPVYRANRFSETGTDAGLRSAVLHWVLRHPGYPAYVLAENVPRLAGLAGTGWSADSLRYASLPTSPAPLLRLGLLVTTALALAGAATARARRLPAGWWLAGGVVLASAAFVNAEQRFAVPLQPWLLLLAAAGLVSGVERAARAVASR
jgi:dolichyl-phosphate-mannose-protein mannosyltransferase